MGLHPPTFAVRARSAPAALALAFVAAAGCASKPAIDPRYRPSESVLEILAVLQHHVPDDTYRFAPARDFTGRNVYRSSLLRLENLERLHADALRAGQLDGVIAFGKARALERLGAYGLASEAYELAAERDPSLTDEALDSADLCNGLERATEIQTELVSATQDSALLEIPSPVLALERYEQRAALLEVLSIEAEDTHYASIVREEIERNDLERARYFVRVRTLLVDGDVRAVAELERVVTLHTESKLSARHMLDLADLYASLSTEYVDRYAPESLDFDPAEFRDLVDSSARLYEMVASRDGTTEKIEATRRLEAFLAFALGVDRDRFTP
jgi:tetratricopeptide (TPR) repeat protein